MPLEPTIVRGQLFSGANWYLQQYHSKTMLRQLTPHGLLRQNDLIATAVGQGPQ